MSKTEAGNRSVSRVELDQRARDARLQLERLERLVVPRAVVTASWFARMVCLFGFGRSVDGSQTGQIHGPLSNRLPRNPQISRCWATSAG